jgi:lipid-binding SYLF domain-containing protein
MAFVVTMSMCLSGIVSVLGDETHSKRIADAAAVLRELRAAPDKGIPVDLWNKASCVAVIPSVKKGAFIIGGEYGKGLMSCRKDEHWSAPSFLILEKGSVGFQLGGETIDLVLLIMNERGLTKLLGDKVTLGAETSVAAGPVGRDERAMTDLQLHAEMLSYSRAQGVFAGVDLTGGILKPDGDDNHDLYGRRMSAKQILTGNTIEAPAAAAPFMAELKRTVSAIGG